jgi:basic membrane protein A and related proteins
MRNRLLLVALLLPVLAACGTGGDTNSGGFKAALLTPGPISDQSWNSGAYAGLLRIRDSIGAQVSHIHTKTPAEFEESFRAYGAQGYNIVFGHGFEFQDAARRVGPEYPNTIYIVSSSDVAQDPNVAGVRFEFANASYLSGILAASLSTTGVLGVIGGTELPPVRESFQAFEAGARSVNPAIQVLTAYIGNWDDASAGKEQALAQIARRADIIFQNADAAGLGVFQAARETGRALVFGTNANQNDIAPEVTIGSVVIDIPHAFLSVAREVAEGRFIARPIELGADAQVVSLVLNPTFEFRIPPDVRDRIYKLQAEMTLGVFRAPRGTPQP